MQKQNKFLLLNLNQKESKFLAQALSNETSRKILDYLAENKEASASILSNNLSIPLPTVDYNLKQLIKANLIESKEFIWSKKGKEVDIYRLARKYIVIAPKSVSLEEIKHLLPIAIISVIASFLIKFFNQTRTISGTSFDKAEVSAQNILTETLPINQNWLWFLYGTLFVIILTTTYMIIRRFKK